MDNNFDENMTAGQENGSSPAASEVPADDERQRDLRDLQDTVTASPLSEAPAQALLQVWKKTFRRLP